ncbi:acetyl/propionyl/methylcrotonyl-CoA carboxylase subunit alpha [Amycolatopsis sp. FDAARGOS 1241]|uniref:acetyl-CoA carboxylase biotin carboxylase subunit n=1 Tax=Amycolatopsis sp. FDAARGOS 1241 TaxID=2778070 RepID=UPI001951A502|nr:acetyl-CoA carboxylase biotin carboxylase subunit [Amycolatopsis sp. FDAARGOS 1241]QRP47827.1 acetyl-CoA carboxylase biotin carboxylase subunit [Amycolatopsis sp. FDAARGOS 1241]
MRKLVIANRGEIAVRIMRTAREMGITTVAVCSEADRGSLAARTADEAVVIGPPPARDSYLNQEAVLNAARDTDADAVHPGFGFLSENAGFAQAVLDTGLTWVGPSPDAIRLMGDKVAAREAARKAGVPVLAGSDGPLDPDADPLALARKVGFPLVLKASAGGGGRGIRLVTDPADFLSALDLTRSEARASFGDDTMYLERFVERARHVEVQVLGDGERVIHLGDRDCSMQRRSQKVLEEAPAPELPGEVRERIRSSSVELAKACRYRGAGTVEFLYDPVRHEAAFIEMNTRLQVEHPVTELVTGIDLVEQQLRIARGEPLGLAQDDVTFTGHAFESRINAEDPDRGFMPSPGTVETLSWPTGARVDSGVEAGDAVAPYYDSMIAKLIVHGPDRATAMARMTEALRGVEITGIATTTGLHLDLFARPEFAAVEHHTKFIETAPGLLKETA